MSENDGNWEAFVSLTNDGEAAYISSNADMLADITGESVDGIISATLVTETLESCGVDVKNLDDPANAALLADLTSTEGLSANDAACLPDNPDGYGEWTE